MWNWRLAVALPAAVGALGPSEALLRLSVLDSKSLGDPVTLGKAKVRRARGLAGVWHQSGNVHALGRRQPRTHPGTDLQCTLWAFLTVLQLKLSELELEPNAPPRPALLPLAGAAAAGASVQLSVQWLVAPQRKGDPFAQAAARQAASNGASAATAPAAASDASAPAAGALIKQADRGLGVTAEIVAGAAPGATAARVCGGGPAKQLLDLTPTSSESLHTDSSKAPQQAAAVAASDLQCQVAAAHAADAAVTGASSGGPTAAAGGSTSTPTGPRRPASAASFADLQQGAGGAQAHSPAPRSSVTAALASAWRALRPGVGQEDAGPGAHCGTPSPQLPLPVQQHQKQQGGSDTCAVGSGSAAGAHPAQRISSLGMLAHVAALQRQLEEQRHVAAQAQAQLDTLSDRCRAMTTAGRCPVCCASVSPVYSCREGLLTT